MYDIIILKTTKHNVHDMITLTQMQTTLKFKIIEA